jgi:hypothetical protein
MVQRKLFVFLLKHLMKKIASLAIFIFFCKGSLHDAVAKCSRNDPACPAGIAAAVGPVRFFSITAGQTPNSELMAPLGSRPHFLLPGGSASRSFNTLHCDLTGAAVPTVQLLIAVQQ